MPALPTLFTSRLETLGFALAAWVALVLPLSAAEAASDDGKTVLCFVSHQTSHGFGAHEYAAGCRLIGDWLARAYPEAAVESRYSIGWPESAETFFRDADTVVFFCSGGTKHLVNDHVEELDRVMRTGAGLACLHYAVEVPIGPSAKGMLAWMGGYFEMNWSVNPHWVANFEVFPGHPAAQGIRPFSIDDEWYFHMRFVEGLKGVTPILSAVAPAETMKRPDGPHSGNAAVRESVAKGEPQHVAWTYERGDDYRRGRGFGFTGLHYHWNWEDDSFRKTVLNGVAWSARLAIPENGVESPRPSRDELEANAVRYGGEQNRGDQDRKAAKAAPSAGPKTGSASAPTRQASPFTGSDLFTGGIEGPACDRDGNLYAVSFGEKRNIGKVSPDGRAELFVTLPEGSTGNGIRFDRDGFMYVADYTAHQILKIDPATKAITVLARESRMSQPNDIAIDADGTLYASDPNWKDGSGQVWRIDRDGGVTLLASDLGTANGIEVSPDGKTLYVNESVQRKVWAFTLTESKTLTEKRLLKEFPDHGFDGMRCDVDGNLHVTRHGKGTVVVLSPRGEILDEIALPGSKPSNLCFGGPDGKTVYVTEVKHTRVLTYRAKKPGLEWARWRMP